MPSSVGRRQQHPVSFLPPRRGRWDSPAGYKAREFWHAQGGDTCPSCPPARNPWSRASSSKETPVEASQSRMICAGTAV